MKITWVSFSLIAILFGLNAAASTALIYQGTGSCDEGCSEAAAVVARMARLDPVFVGPDSRNEELFRHAKVWIQPGGYAVNAIEAMSDELKENIVHFVAHGGGYVGFCAGAFIATAKVGRTRVNGLGILPGFTQLYRAGGAQIMPILWQGVQRSIYWEGGPYFAFPTDSPIETVATYADGLPATVRAPFHHGRVFVTGAHPEAPQFWRMDPPLEDPDGLDLDLARKMVEWAGRIVID